MQQYKSLSNVGNHLLAWLMNNIGPDIYKAWLTNTQYSFPVDFYEEYLYSYIDDVGDEFTYYDKIEDKRKKYQKIRVLSGEIQGRAGHSDYKDWYTISCTNYEDLEKYLNREISEYLKQCPAIYQSRIQQYGRNFTPKNEIEQLEYQKYMRELGNNVNAGTNNMFNQQQPAINRFSSTDDLIIDYLTRNNIPIRRNNDDDCIYFDYEGRHFINLNIDTDEGFSYTTIRLPAIYSVTQENLNHCLNVVNKLNRDNWGKFFVNGSGVDIEVTILLDSTPELNELMPALINLILEWHDSFNKAIQE